MSRPQDRERYTASHARRIVGTFVAFALSFAALIAMPQAAHAADVVDVPDANFKAVLNSAIAATDGTTRAPDQDITTAEALTVTSVGSYDEGTGVTIADFTGVAAFKNLYSLDVYNTAESISLEPFSGSSIVSLSLGAANTGAPGFAGKISSDLSPLGSIDGLLYLTLRNYVLPDAKLRTMPVIPALQYFTAQSSGIVDVSPLAKLTGLESLDVSGNKIRDLSPIATMPGLMSVTAADNLISDISFVSDMESLTDLYLDGNLIEDVSALAPMADTSRYKLSNLSLNSNRIPDLSPLAAFQQNTFGTYSQSIYVGPYLDGGVPIKLRSKSGSVPTSVTPTDAGTYDGATDRLVSNDPSAPFLEVAGDFDPIWKVYFSEAPDKLGALRVNEVESNGDGVNGDWVELYNPASAAVDISGLVVSDSKNTSKLIVPAGTKIPAKGYQTIVTENAAKVGPFGLGEADSVRIFAPETTDLTAATPIDSYTWTEHATTTFGRTVPGAGRWTTTTGGTFGAVNEFPLSTAVPTVKITGDATSTTGSAKVTASVSKPDSTDLATDATGTVVFAIDGIEKSGPVTVTGGKAEWTATGLAGSASGTAHQVTARYVSAGDADPYDDSVASAAFTVTVTIGEFAGDVTLSTTTPRYCDTVTSNVTSISPAPEQLSYQWQVLNQSGGYVNIPGATSASHPMYTVNGTAVDVALARPYRLLVTAVGAGHASKTWTMQTAAISSDEWSTDSKKIAVLSTTTPKVGETITATHDAWTTCLPGTLNYQPGYAYQWLRDGQPISGAADEVTEGIGGAGPKKVSYTLTPADAGHKISLRVRGVRPAALFAGSATESAATTAVAGGAFATSPAPVVDNTSPKVGDTVKASTPAWSPVASMAYQWLRDGAPITGATSASYTVVAADADHTLGVKATGTAEGYMATEKTSEATAKVARLVFAGAPAPVVTGGTTVGDTLTAAVGAWSPVASMSWQWLRDGQPIAGATSASYTLTAADQGHTISVRVTGAADGYGSESKTSAATPAVLAKPAPGTTQVNKVVSSKYTVKVSAHSGKKLRLRVTAKGVPASTIDKKITVKIAGIKGSYKVTVKNGKATISLGAKAKSLKNGKKVTVTLTLPQLTASAGTMTYTVAKATMKVKVKLK